jgi:hypothetical protein
MYVDRLARLASLVIGTPFSVDAIFLPVSLAAGNRLRLEGTLKKPCGLTDCGVGG